MKIWAFFPLAILFTACANIVGSPSWNGDVAPCPNILYAPQRRTDECDRGCEERTDPDRVYKLSELIDVGLQNNPETRVAWANAKASAFNLYGTRSAYLPQIDLQETVLLEDTEFRFREGDSIANVDTGNQGGLLGYSEQYSQTLTVQYLLFDFGTRSGTVEAAKQALVAANWTHHYTLQSVIYEVSNRYYDELEALAFITSARKNLENAKLAMDSAEAQFEAGIKTKVDLLQAKTNYFNAEIDLENRIANEKVTSARLAKAVGMPADTMIKIEEIPFKIEPKQIQEGIDILIASAKTQRADLAAKEAVVWQNKAEIDVAVGNFFPRLSADAFLNRTAYAKSPVVTSHDYTVALVLDIPLFSGFYDYNQIKNAKAEYEAAYYDWRNSEDQILVEVIVAYTQYVTANKNLTTTQEYLQFAEESFQAILIGYQEGIQTILDLLNSQNVLADARARLIQSRASWLRAIVNIAFTTGLLGVNADELSIATPEMLMDKPESTLKECDQEECDDEECDEES